MGFFDLNIPYHESDRRATDKSSLRGRRLKLALKAMELGYTGIAYNRTHKGVMSESDRCATPLFPLTKLSPSSSSFFASVKLHRELLNIAVSSPFRQYTRLTVVIDIPSQASVLNAGNPILRSYDIVAVRPMNQNAFDQACQTSEVDIIAIDFSEKLLFRLKQPMVKAAIKRGVYFEITYSGLIADAESRRQMISNCKLLIDWTKGKNLVICSAAPSATELRGPQDVSNLFSLIGLCRERAKAAISKNCRSLLAKALRKKHFYKEAVKVEEVPSGRQVIPALTASGDWLKWDPISSGEGDILLDDMEKSFAMSKTVKENARAINFSSNLNGLPAHGLQINDLISVPGASLEPPDTNDCALALMETEKDAAAANPEEQGGLNPLHKEQSSLSENQCSLSNLSKDQGGIILLPEGQASSSGATNICLASGTQDFEVSLDLIPKAPSSVPPLKEQSRASFNVAKIEHRISDIEQPGLLSLPTYNGKSADSDDIAQISDEKLKYSNGLEKNHSDGLDPNIVQSETQVQDIPSPIHGGNALHAGVGVCITKTDTLITNNHDYLKLSNTLTLHKSTLPAFPLESTMENQLDIDVPADKGVAVEKVPGKIDGENIQAQPLASSNTSSQDVYVGGHCSKMIDSFVKLGDGLPIEGFLNLKTDSSEPRKDDMMEDHVHQIDSVMDSQSPSKSQAGRKRRKHNSSNQHNSSYQPFSSPFKRFLRPRASKRKYRK